MKPKVSAYYSRANAEDAYTRLARAHTAKAFPPVGGATLRLLRHAIEAAPAGFTLATACDATGLPLRLAQRTCDTLSYALLTYATGTVRLRRVRAKEIKTGGRPPYRYQLLNAG